MLTFDFALRASVGLLPVLALLAALRVFDSYKLVTLRLTLTIIVLGTLTAGASFVGNMTALDALGVDFKVYSRYAAPLIEELLKGSVLVWLITRHRIAFLVDAAICGFAVGAGFAIIENIFYLMVLPDAALGVWIVRGFGTAIMHGGVTAIFGMAGLMLHERQGGATLRAFLPGLLVAAVIHSIYNHFLIAPIYSTLGILVVLPPLVVLVFERSERNLEDWLEVGFDADTELLELLNSGRLSDSRVGRYLHSLKARFHGPVVADMLCYLRLHTELALRAKGVLLMRENGFEVPLDDLTRSKFEELRYLERSIGPTGLLAMKPFLHVSPRDLWQLYVLESTG
jgi:RsiW-degrading membrane proteinase PrsW (M82 family)